MKKIGSVLLACVLMVTALTGCGGENSSSMPEVDKSSLTVGYISKNTTYDPAQITAHMQLYVLLCCMDRLVGVNPETGDAEYYLAKSHTESEDGLEWTFELRDDVYFSNGEKLTAKDVKYSLETIMASPYMSDNVSFIRSVEVIDDLHVKLNLKEYTNGAWSMLDYVLIFPADYYEEVGGDGFSNAPIGSGPYVVTKMDIATGNIELTRNENYWGDAPAIEHINFRYISSSDTALISLEKGEIDFSKLDLL